MAVIIRPRPESGAALFQQPWPRTAYFTTLTCSCYWVTLFVYGPIYIVEAGLPD
ncbi:MAG: hypothetical protein R3E89_11965 [Thiolinea sp.]